MVQLSSFVFPPVYGSNSTLIDTCPDCVANVVAPPDKLIASNIPRGPSTDYWLSNVAPRTPEI